MDYVQKFHLILIIESGSGLDVAANATAQFAVQAAIVVIIVKGKEWRAAAHASIKAVVRSFQITYT